MKNSYFFIFLTPLAVFFLFELFLLQTKTFYPALALLAVLVLVSSALVAGKKIFSTSSLGFAFLPFFFTLSLSIYLLFLPRGFLAHFLAIICSLFVFYYLKNIRAGEKSYFLENVSSYGNFLGLFFFFAALYGLKAFLGISVWILVLAALAAIIGVILEVFWANNISIKENLAQVFIISLVLVQLLWAIFFLPLNYNALGLISAICYYIIMGLFKPLWRRGLTMRTVKLYLIFGLTCIFLILITAKWI